MSYTVHWLGFETVGSYGVLGLEGKNSWALNVFTLGPTAQATLVMDEMKMTMSKNWRRSVWTGCNFWNEANGSQWRIHGSIMQMDLNVKNSSTTNLKWPQMHLNLKIWRTHDIE